MAGSITPLPVMLEEEEDRKAYAALEAPKSIVVRYGYMKMVAELLYDGEAKPGCGSRIVVRTKRGIELAQMLTTTCPNSGCGSAVSRKQMLEYIENSGGKDYPFSTHGKVLRVATSEDMLEQARLDDGKSKMIQFTKALVREMDLPMRLVDVEMLLGGERVIFHYTAEQWVDFRDMVRRLAQEYQTRIEMHQVNARDEARLVADYEKCGQYCCCKQFLKVLKPVSMKAAKMQKATLDPTKISGRCGRLMCCLRYEDKTYSDLKKMLPHKQTRVITDDGLGTVIDTQILTQLVLVRLDSEVINAFPMESIEVLAKDADPEEVAKKVTERTKAKREAEAPPEPRPAPARERKPKPRSGDRAPSGDRAKTGGRAKTDERAKAGDDQQTDKPKRKRWRRRRRRGDGKGGDGDKGRSGGNQAS